MSPHHTVKRNADSTCRNQPGARSSPVCQHETPSKAITFEVAAVISDDGKAPGRKSRGAGRTSLWWGENKQMRRTNANVSSKRCLPPVLLRLTSRERLRVLEREEPIWTSQERRRGGVWAQGDGGVVSRSRVRGEMNRVVRFQRGQFRNHIIAPSEKK